MTDDLTLIVGESRLAGWTRIRVTRGIERCPSDFELELTEKYPGVATDLVVQPGDPCQVLLGNDIVITGYIDRFVPSFDKRNHRISVTGRSKCADLVDCAAEWPGGQITGSSVLQIAQKLAEAYGITVTATGDVGAGIPQFNLMLGETAYDVIERICRYRALLAYDGADGNLVLSGVGSTQAANGFSEGINVEKAMIAYTMDQRYSEYFAFLQSMDVLTDAGNGGNLLGKAYDKGVTRHRRRVIIAEAGGGGQDVALQRANWEAARRYGRAAALQITTDTWRDSSGALYAPNTLVPLSLPTLKLDGKTWVVGEVTYTRDERGTHAQLLVMPPEAFNPEPILLQPFPADVPAGTVQ